MLKVWKVEDMGEGRGVGVFKEVGIKLMVHIAPLFFFVPCL